jgi:CO/xanthine dehydrogenase FAD-binding subunit
MASLVGESPTAEAFARAAEAALGQATLRTSKHRATEEYRAEMIHIQLPRTLALAADRAATGRVVPEGVGK